MVGQVIIIARYASKCPVCGQGIVAGLQVNWARGHKATHVGCAQRPAVLHRLAAQDDVFAARRREPAHNVRLRDEDWGALQQQREREEDERVARYKAERDARFQESAQDEERINLPGGDWTRPRRTA